MMRRSRYLALASVLLLLTQALSPAVAAVWLASAGPGTVALAQDAASSAPMTEDGSAGTWVVLCTATGLKRVFLTADGRLIDPAATLHRAGDTQAADDTRSAGPAPDAGIALACPYSVLAGALTAPAPPLLAVPTVYAGPALTKGAGMTVPATGLAAGPPLGARAPPA